MSFPWNITNPGFVIGAQLTSGEAAFVTNLSGLSYAQGDILFHDGSNLNRLAAGTSGYFLKTQGAGANPVWAAIAGGGDMLASTYDPATISEQLVGLVATQTLTNKTLTTPTITLKQSTTPTPTAEGDIQWDTDNNQIKIGDGASTLTFSDDTQLATAAQGSLADSALQNIVEDTTPQLGGSLDVNGQKIVSVSNGNIDIEPNGTGNVLLGNLTFDADQTVGAGQDNYVLTYDNATGLVSLEAAASGSGDVVGPASATDNAIARFDTTTGKLLQNSGVTISDNGAIVTTIADTTNEVGLTINQNDTTNNPNAASIINAGTGPGLYIENTNVGSPSNMIELYHNSASPATGDNTAIAFNAENSTGTKKSQAYISGVWDTTTAASEDSSLEIWATSAGAELNGGVKVKTNAAGSGILSSNGNQDLILQTGNATTGSITITDGADGDITIAPNGSAKVNLGTYVGINDGGVIYEQGTWLEMLEFSSVASAVNQIRIENSATGNGPTIYSHGGDTNIDINLVPKGTGVVEIKNGIALGTATSDTTSIKLNDSALADEKWSGTTIAATAGATLAVGDVCYLASTGKWVLVDGILDGTDTGFNKKLGICVLASTDTNPTEILLDGVIASAAFPVFTVGSPVYLSDTAGDLVVAQPSTTNFAIRIVGYAVSATVLHFSPDNSYIVHV